MSSFVCFQSFFGFGPSAEVDIVLDGQDSRKTAEIKTEDGKKERHYLYYDGESVSGKVHSMSYSGHVDYFFNILFMSLNF